VIDVQYARPLPSEELLKAGFPLDQLQTAQIFAVQKQKIKGKEDALTPPKKQIVENRSPVLIHASDLAINNGVLDAQVLADPLSKVREVAECVSVARDKVAAAILDVGERTEAVDFQLEDVVVGVEWLRTARKPDGAEVSGQHRRRIARLQRAGRKPYPVGLWASVNSYRSGLANASRTFRVILNTHRERESSRPSRYAGHFAGERV